MLLALSEHIKKRDGLINIIQNIPELAGFRGTMLEVTAHHKIREATAYVTIGSPRGQEVNGFEFVKERMNLGHTGVHGSSLLPAPLPRLQEHCFKEPDTETCHPGCPTPPGTHTNTSYSGAD